MCTSKTFCSHSSWTAISAIRKEKNELKASLLMSSANKPTEGSLGTTDLPRKATSLKTETWHRDTAVKFKGLK